MKDRKYGILEYFSGFSAAATSGVLLRNLPVFSSTRAVQTPLEFIGTEIVFGIVISTGLGAAALVNKLRNNENRSTIDKFLALPSFRSPSR